MCSFTYRVHTTSLEIETNVLADVYSALDLCPNETHVEKVQPSEKSRSFDLLFIYYTCKLEYILYDVRLK